MKYCSKCGNELRDEAVICPKCGCAVESKNIMYENQKDAPIKVESQTFDLSWTPLMFGILAIFRTIWLCLLLGNYTSFINFMDMVCTYLGLDCCGILTIITGVKYLKTKKTCPLIGLIIGGINVLIQLILLIVAIVRFFL